MEHSENLKGIASGFINYKVGENPVEQNLPAREIGAGVAAVCDAGQLMKALEEFGDDSIRRFQALLFQKVKPDTVNIEDRIIPKLK